ncbi:MAG TPA: prepilin-type N-terminal cleavage/methylation domain-containing protein [Frankiaceae bacterium]|nr:prepilin-type N-terminal cleavage/methylation domain-containing protein [Frankiaceae bacterium]
MLARIRKAQQEEGGFTLIELLVVIIIIGILAAIAIPTFLRQREKGWLAAAKSDVKNAVTANESYGTDNDGSYTDVIATLQDEGFNPSPKVTVLVTLTNADATTFTVCGSHAQVDDKVVRYDSATGVTAVDDTTGTC